MQDEPRIVPLRLQKFLARSGVASRRGSEDLMTAGRVTVNGKVVTELGSRINPLVDEVAVDGVMVQPNADPITLMLNKPAGFVTTMTDPHGRPCVADLVPSKKYPGLFPIGRLDMDTTGLLLFSTDGELGNYLLHPKFHVEKTYEVWAAGTVSQEEASQLSSGILLEDGITLPATVRIISQDIYKGTPCTLVQISIREGRKRQVKRMFEALGHPVIKLHRSAFGPLSLDDLAKGTWRLLTKEEISMLSQPANLK